MLKFTKPVVELTDMTVRTARSAVVEVNVWFTVRTFVAASKKLEPRLLFGSPQLTATVCVSRKPGSVKLPVSVTLLFSSMAAG